MDIPDDVLTIFSTEIDAGRPATIDVPDNELEIGNLSEGGRYRIAVLPPVNDPSTSNEGHPTTIQEPPVEVGDELEVEIEDIGDKEDGIARIGPGYVIFVSNTEVGDRVSIEITEARENFAFGESKSSLKI